MPTTKRLLTDETGQALVTAINNIVAAVKPNATEIQMSPSDTTTVATAITNINNKLTPSGLKNGNINTYFESDVCWIQSTNSSGTQPGYNYYQLEIIPNGNGQIVQRATQMGTGTTAIRIYANNAWSAWQELASKSSVDTLNSNIQNISKGKRYHVYGVATAIQATEIRFFLPLTNYDGTAAVTVHAFGVTNIWSASEGASHVTVIGNTSGGVAFKATGDSGTFVPTASYYYDLDVTIN